MRGGGLYLAPGEVDSLATLCYILHAEGAMAKKVSPTDNLERAFTDFEKQHPSIAEALRVFDISMQSYAAAVNALSRSTTVESHHTEGVGAYLDRHQT